MPLYPPPKPILWHMDCSNLVTFGIFLLLLFLLFNFASSSYLSVSLWRVDAVNMLIKTAMGVSSRRVSSVKRRSHIQRNEIHRITTGRRSRITQRDDERRIYYESSDGRSDHRNKKAKSKLPVFHVCGNIRSQIKSRRLKGSLSIYQRGQ